MERSEAARHPVPHDPRAAEKSGKKETSTEQKSGFESHMRQRTAQRNIFAIEPLRITEHFCKRTNRDNLRTKQSKHHTEDHRVYIERDTRREHAWTRQKAKHEGQPNNDQRRSRQKK